MKARAKQGTNAPERIMEIVGLLLRRIIESPSGVRHEGDLVKGLEERGYGRAEIDAAMELVFAVPEIINCASQPGAGNAATKTTRVFSIEEEIKLSLAVRGRLLQYRVLGLLSDAEWEEVLMHLLLNEAREVGLADLHFALRKVVADEERLLLLLPNPARPILNTVN